MGVDGDDFFNGVMDEVVVRVDVGGVDPAAGRVSSTAAMDEAGDSAGDEEKGDGFEELGEADEADDDGVIPPFVGEGWLWAWV